ncbi:MAG: hypothetical protein ACMUIU_17595 [bacterium]
MKSLQLFLMSLFIITIFIFISSTGFAVITTVTTAPGVTALMVPTITPTIRAPVPTTPTFGIGGISLWPTAIMLPTAPTFTTTLPTFTPTFPTFTPTVPTFTAPVPTAPTFGGGGISLWPTAIMVPTVPTFTPTVPTFTPTFTPTFPTFAPTFPTFTPTVPTFTAPVPTTPTFGGVPIWPTGLMVPATVPVTGGLWPTAMLPLI